MNGLPESLRVERHGAVLTVRLSRANKRNALDDVLVGAVSGGGAFDVLLLAGGKPVKASSSP